MTKKEMEIIAKEYIQQEKYIQFLKKFSSDTEEINRQKEQMKGIRTITISLSCAGIDIYGVIREMWEKGL